ncbi:MAG: flagellar basal body P-ring formation chaperone FlgA [Desulfobacterota bacterium]|nr:flagellar basal body P-ring formation chaperone FlgA [Thermodesulfobacteriota bacterium]
MRNPKKKIFLLFLSGITGGTLFLMASAATGQTSLSFEVFHEGNGFEPETVKKSLITAYQLLYPEKRFRVEVKAIHLNEKVVLPPGPLLAELTLPEQARRGGTISTSILFRAQGKEAGKIRVSGRVEVYTDVLAAGQYMGKHQEIQEKDLQWVSRSLNLLPPDYLVEKSDVVGKRVTISINRGEVLRAGIVEEPPLLRRGDRVILLFESPKLRITALGEAKEEGRRGDRIRLINLTSRKEVTGRVMNEQMVEVDF